MEKSKIYIVMKSTGQYEDSFESPYAAFTNKDKAEAFAETKNDYYHNLEEQYRAIDFDVQGKMEELFDRYLEDTNKEMFEAYKDAIKPENTKNIFNWDIYYDEQLVFYENKELFNKYLEICNVTDKEKVALEVSKEYDDASYDGMPYFYVSGHVLDLEE
jgi:hypothetical protein